MEPTMELRQAVKSYREGNKQAFTMLYEESCRYVYTCIYEVIGGNDNVQDTICDIMQDTYVEVSRKIGQLDSEDSFLFWTKTIAIRKCYAWLKKNKKYVLLDEEDDTLTNLADDDNIIPEDLMQDKEKQRLLREIINTQLTQMQKLCVVAFYYNEQKQSEIAKELGIPENTVKTNLSRARAKIRDGVLDLEKRQGTKLYGLAPILLLFYEEDVAACTVPGTVTAAVQGSVAAAGKLGMKHLFGKMAEASVKAKVAAGAAGAAAVVAVGSAAYVAMQDKEESWEEEFRNILMEDDEAVGFDLNDFEEDGIPELVILEEDGSLTLCSFREGEETSVTTLPAGEERGDERHDVQEQNHYGYDYEYGRLINLMDVAISVDGSEADHLTVPMYIQYRNGKRKNPEQASYGYTVGAYPVEWVYFWGGDKDQYEISREEAMGHLAEAQARFNEIKYTDITKQDIQERFEEFKEDGNRRRKKRVEEAADWTEEETGAETQESKEPQESQGSRESQEAPVEETEITLSEKEQSDIKMLAVVISMNSYFFSDDMYGGRYPVDDVAINMKLIDAIGNMGLGDNSYMEYLPPTEMGDGTYKRYCRIDDVQSYLKNVFGIENADISAFCEGDRVVFSMVGDFVLVDATIDSAVLMPDNTYKINGVFSVWIMVDDFVEEAYPYELTVIKNDASPFGFQVISMEFGEKVPGEQPQQTQGDGTLSDILLNPSGNSAYYPQEIEYGKLYFALLDIDQDGEDEIMLGTTNSFDYYGKPGAIVIFNVLKYDRSTGEVWDFDGDHIYHPLDPTSWHFYDTGVLMTMAEMNYGHTNFWNLLTGEFTDADKWYPDDPEHKFESEGHSRIYNADGTHITGEEADRIYQSLQSGTEIPIIWYEVYWENVQALVEGTDPVPVDIPMPYGRYTSNRGAEVEFFQDGTVRVSEGGSSTYCSFTIDGAGNLTIFTESETIEGTYNAPTDVLWIENVKFRK